jgi:hypothetical protein
MESIDICTSEEECLWEERHVEGFVRIWPTLVETSADGGGGDDDDDDFERLESNSPMM